jgi:serine/threonine protein kinase
MTLMAKRVLNNGKYVLNAQLDKGLFGITYQATHRELGQTVVIKTLSENLCQHSSFDLFKQQFLDLAQRLIRCRHPNLIKVLDYFEDTGRPYIVMEYIQGYSLAQVIESDVLPEHQAIKYIRQVGSALLVLHDAGLLHRNVSPQNIIRRQDTDSVVLCEFSLTCEFTAVVKQSHASLLCAGYAPLEQYYAEGKHTKATDIYASAATLYFLLTGKTPLPAPVRKREARLRNAEGQELPLEKPSKVGQPSSETSVDVLFPPKLKPVISSAVKQAISRGLEISIRKRPQTVEAWLSLFPRKKDTLVEKTSAVPAHLLGKSQEQIEVKHTKKNSKTIQPQEPGKNNSNHPPFVKGWLTKNNNKVKSQKTPSTKRKTRKVLLPLQALLMTGAIAASAGAGFGFALRVNKPSDPGSSILHTEQSFPPTSNWPMSEPRL